MSDNHVGPEATHEKQMILVSDDGAISGPYKITEVEQCREGDLEVTTVIFK